MGTWGSSWGTFWGSGSPDYEADAFDRLMEQYKQSPNVKALLSMVADRWEHIAHVAGLVEAAFSLEAAEGVQLDVIGRIIDLSRGLDTDTRYRLLLEVRAQQILPAGRNRIPTILRIIRILTGNDDRDITHHESPPMGYYDEVDDLTADELADLMRFLPLTRPTCYQASLVLSSVDGFVYDDSTGSIAPQGQGYGNSLDATMGGGYAGVQEIP